MQEYTFKSISIQISVLVIAMLVAAEVGAYVNRHKAERAAIAAAKPK